jgi:pimeloyl-ACP methyl ester carboxylesterase
MLDWGQRQPSFLERLKVFKCPTLVACGDGDYWIPAKFSKRIAERIPGARYVEMPGCGHVPVREQPQMATELIVNFVSEVSRE